MNLNTLQKYELIRNKIDCYLEKSSKINKTTYFHDTVIGSSSVFPYQPKTFRIETYENEEDNEWCRSQQIREKIDNLEEELRLIRYQIFQIKDDRIRNIVLKRYCYSNNDWEDIYKEFGSASAKDLENEVIKYFEVNNVK